MTAGQGRLFAPDRKRLGRIRRGFDQTLAELRRSERWRPEHEAVTALCRVLADEVDAATADPDESRFVRARVASTYQAALAAFLTATLLDDRDDDTLGGLLAELLHPEDPEQVE